EASLTMVSRPAATRTRVAPRNTTLIASRSVLLGIRRPSALVVRVPLASAAIARIRTAKVVTLMPPAVEADPPPTNIRASVSSIVVAVEDSMSTIANPPERIMVEAKKALPIFSHQGAPPTVAGFVHSNAAHAAAPSTSRMMVVYRVSLVCSVHRLRVHFARIRFRKTGKPKLPTNTPTAIGTNTNGFDAKGSRPSGCEVNPALAKAETE